MKTKPILSLLLVFTGIIFVLSLIGQDKSPFGEIWGKLAQHDSQIAALQTSIDNLESRIFSVGDVTLDATGKIPGSFQGQVVKLYLKDVPYLVLALRQLFGVSSLKLADITSNVRHLGLAVETYEDASPTSSNFTGFRFARVLGQPIGTDETDIFWDIRVTSDLDGIYEDMYATYKLIHVTAYLK